MVLKVYYRLLSLEKVLGLIEYRKNKHNVIRLRRSGFLNELEEGIDNIFLNI